MEISFKMCVHADHDHCSGAVSAWRRCCAALWSELETGMSCYSGHCWVGASDTGLCWTETRFPQTARDKEHYEVNANSH